MIINALLTTARERVENSDQQEKIDTFAPRVLATLLQNRPSLIFVEGAADLDLIYIGRTLYCSVVVCACQRVIEIDPTLACKLFPVSIQILLQLCQSGDEEVDEEVAESVMMELSALLRAHFQRLINSPCPASDIDACITKSLQAMERVLLPQFQTTWSISLRPLVLMMQYAQDHTRVPDNVRTLCKLRNEAKGDVNAQRAVEAAIGSLVEGVGIETFWRWIDWSGCGKSSGSGKAATLQV